MTDKSGKRSVLVPLRRYKKSILTFLIFVAYAGAVFWSNYDSLQQLQRDALLQFQLETEKQAAAISYYFSERQNDILELAASEPVVSFFKNRDLGMSYQYGLGMNVQTIEDRFEKIVNRKRVGEQVIYTGLVLIDNSGVPIANWNRPVLGEDLRARLAPDKHETRILFAEERGVLLISAPVWIDQLYRGELLAWTRADTSLAQFGRARAKWYNMLVDQQEGTPLNSDAELSQLSARFGKSLKELAVQSESASIATGRKQQEQLVVAKVNIVQTPLSYVSMTSEYPMERGSARLFLLAVGVIPLIVMLGAFLDMRERRRLEELREDARVEAERLAAARGEFLANMSHEIRTPMNAIVGMTELCLGTELTSKQSNYLTKIQGASNSLLRIVNDILDFSRIESGKLEIEQIPFDFDQVLDDLGALFSEKAGAKSIELVFDVDDSVNHCFVGDSLRLEQILINLIGNAIKFSDRGSITVRVRKECLDGTSARLHLEVIDEGIGLSPDQQARLFNAFTQADATTTRRYGGTGLGLTICKRLVELMNGSIRVDSVLGQGSNFSFTVCLGVDHTRVSAAATMARQLAPFAKQPVLVVDDSSIYRSAITAQLRQIGIMSVVCASGDEAVAAVTRPNAPSYLAILVDYKMPVCDGVETARRLRKCWTDSPAPPIILLSTHSHDQEPAPDSSSFDSLLAKPTSASRLFAEIASFVGLEHPNSLSQDTRTAIDLTRLEGLEVLLVDDVPLNQEVVRDMLEGAGMRVRLANNGREAINAIAFSRPDCVLMDCQMPVMDGYAATREIRADDRYCKLPIIALTANALPTERERCREAGMDDYVAKPVKSSELLAVLANHLASHMAKQPAAIVTESAAWEGEAPLLDLPGIDGELGLRYANGKPALYRKLLLLFLESHGRDFESIFQSALENGDWEGVTRQVHSLKSAAKTIGANRLGDLAKALEEACHSRQREAVSSLFSSLMHELNGVCAGLVAATR